MSATHGNSHFRPRCIFASQEFIVNTGSETKVPERHDSLFSTSVWALRALPAPRNPSSGELDFFTYSTSPSCMERQVNEPPYFTYDMPSISQMLSPLILPTTLESKRPYLHFVDEETGPQRQGEVPCYQPHSWEVVEPGLSSDRNSHYLLYNTPSQKDNGYQKIKSLVPLYHWFPGTNPLPQFP